MHKGRFRLINHAPHYWNCWNTKIKYKQINIMGAGEHDGVSFCFVPFRFYTFAGFVSGFHTSRNLCARTGDRFSFSVARDQMLVAWGDRAPLEHSLAILYKCDMMRKIQKQNKTKKRRRTLSVYISNLNTQVLSKTSP